MASLLLKKTCWPSVEHISILCWRSLRRCILRKSGQMKCEMLTTAFIKLNGQGCKSRRFSLLRNHPLTATVDWQSIRVQEIAQHETGKVPRTVEVELSEDLCDAARPGDVVTVTGVVD